MTLEDYIKELQAIKNKLKDKPVLVRQPNGLETNPEIKFKTEMPTNLEFTEENVTAIIIQ